MCPPVTLNAGLDFVLWHNTQRYLLSFFHCCTHRGEEDGWELEKVPVAWALCAHMRGVVLLAQVFEAGVLKIVMNSYGQMF